MGHTSTPLYVLEIQHTGITCTPMCWSCKQSGRPTEENLNRWMESYIASIQPGGCNSHLAEKFGTGATPMNAFIRRNIPHSEPIVSWSNPRMVN